MTQQHDEFDYDEDEDVENTHEEEDAPEEKTGSPYEGSHLWKKLEEGVGTSQPLMIVRTEEWDDAESTIADACKQYGWNLWLWDAKVGVTDAQGRIAKTAVAKPTGPVGGLAPVPAAPTKLRPHASLMAAIDTLAAMKPPQDSEEHMVSTVLIVRNIHKLWREGDHEQVLLVLQTLQGIIKPFKNDAKVVIGMTTPGEMPPPELMPVVDIVDHKLPTKEEFKPVLACVEPPEEVDARFKEVEVSAITEASQGLTRLQAEKSYATAMLRLTTAIEVERQEAKQKNRKPAKIDVGRFVCEVVEEEKNLILNADGMLKRHDGSENFDAIGGNEALKEYLRLIMRPEARRKKSKRNCVLEIGPPGTGKTLFAKALGQYTGRKTYSGNLSSNKSKYVGESEGNTRRMFARASAMNNIVLYFDEINEQVAGGESEGHAVDTAIRQNLMEWLDTHHVSDDVFVMATANDISGMHMALTRPGRVDSIWYVGLPGKVQKQAIWQICVAKYALNPEQYEKLPDDTGWAGVEIDACCATADNFDITVEAASKYIIPSTTRVKEKIDRLEDWAHGRCLDAETGETFRRDKKIEPEATGSIGEPTRRRIHPISKKRS